MNLTQMVTDYHKFVDWHYIFASFFIVYRTLWI